MIGINRVRNVVLNLLNKSNRGFISPMEFDTFCDLAQRDLFENSFYQLNAWINKENRRLSNTEFADIPKNIREQIDIFAMYSTPSNFTYDAGDDLWSYTGSDLYRTGGLSLVNSQGKKIDVEEVQKGVELNKMINSNMVAPTTTYPIYVKLGESYRTYPQVPTGYSLELFYLRTPKTPKWSYVAINGNPVYSPNADLQDIELHESLFSLFVVKVCGYCGLSIRENEVVAIAANEEATIVAKES